jgi:hypothetical protein
MLIDSGDAVSHLECALWQQLDRDGAACDSVNDEHVTVQQRHPDQWLRLGGVYCNGASGAIPLDDRFVGVKKDLASVGEKGASAL